MPAGGAEETSWYYDKLRDRKSKPAAELEHGAVVPQLLGRGVRFLRLGDGNSQFHQFGVFQTFNWRRVQLTFLDQFSYLPAAQFGFGAGTSAGVAGRGRAAGTRVCRACRMALRRTSRSSMPSGRVTRTRRGLQFNFADLAAEFDHGRRSVQPIALHGIGEHRIQ